MNIPKNLPDDNVLLQGFVISSFLGLAAFAAPVVAPIALTGMALSQGMFWSKRVVNNDNELNDNSN